VGRLWLDAGLMVFGCWMCVFVCVLVILLVVFSGVVLGWWVGGCVCLVVVFISCRYGNGVFLLFVVSMCGFMVNRLWWCR